MTETSVYAARKRQTSRKPTKPGKPRKSRKQRKDKGLIRLTDRDLLVLKWIGEQYAARLDILQLLLGRDAEQPTKIPGVVTESTARRVVSRWKAEGLVESRRFFFGKPEWVWLTPTGLSQMDLAYRSWSPKVSTLNHFHSVNQVRLRIEKGYEESFVWRSERTLRRLYRDNKGIHVPDAELLHEAGVIGIEVELTQKSQQRIRDIVDKLAHQYEQVWYFVNQTTEQAVRAEVAHFDEGKFHLYDIERIRSNE